MAATLCGCTAPRCMTPDMPIIKRTFRPGSRHISTITEQNETDSRYTSTRSDQLREIQQLFNEDNIADSDPNNPTEKSYDSSTVSSKHSKLASFFRRRLSRTFSKSKLDKPDPEKLKEARTEIKSNLTNDKGPDAGGYDADAAVLDNVDETVTSPKEAEESDRGRAKVRRHSIPFSTWSGPIGHTHGYHRRSHSMHSITSRPDSPSLHMRLPSFSVDRDTSHTWKKGVMESLQIQSPSTSNLVRTPIRKSTQTRERSERSLIAWPLREDVLTPDSEAPLIEASASETGSVHLLSARPSADIDYITRAGPSLDRGMSSSNYGGMSSSNYGSGSSGSQGRPHFFMRPERRPARASNASVHLHTMGISRHLRSTSMSSAGVYSKPATRAPTAANTRAHSPAVNTGDASRTHLTIEDLPPLPPSATKTRASSEYSMDINRENSPLPLQQQTKQKIVKSTSANRLSAASKLSNARATNSRCSSLQAPKGNLPDDNQSTSNLSDASKNSSKVSRFKEEFDTPDKKSKKRTSIANMFNQLAANVKQARRRRTESIGSLDGALDEPRRLQRAMALTNQTDAAGLLAKAIRDKQAEKSAMYLKGNKDAAQREIFRQRSSSFCRPRGDSLAKDESGVRQHDWHRRSTSETLLRPDASLPTLQPPMFADAVPRSHSTGHLTPEFKPPVFSSGSPFLTPDGRPPSPGRKQSLAIGPMSNGPSDIPRRPSFQLNDMPALIETPEPSSIEDKGKRASVSVSFARPTTADTDDSSVDMGAWSRYPSHTREARTGSAGIKDNVKTRDFAYDVNPMNIAAESSNDDGTASKSKRKKRKKKRAGTLPKSRSMMFGGLRNYARIFTRSSSAEFLNYGKGHRSSISAGGALEHPELELLPPVFAPMPTIPAEEDPALAAGKEEIELINVKHRRKDHGHSFVEPLQPAHHHHHLHHHAGPTRMDGASDVNKGAHRPEEARRVASSPALVGSNTLADVNGAPVNSANAYARHYESCVYLPPSTSHSTVSKSNLNFNMLHETSYSRMTNHSLTAPHSPADSNLIDKMLASNPASANVSPLPSPLASPILGPAQMPSIGEVSVTPKRVRGHGHSKSATSVASLRASSMDLLRTLKEAEERERQRALEDLLNRARNSLSEERRKMSIEASVQTLEAEATTPLVESYEMSGHLSSGHQTCPGAWRGSSSVEAN